MKDLRNRRWPAFLLAVAILAQPLTAAAQSQEVTIEASGDRLGKFIDYALCAVSIVAASTGVGAALAVLTCAKAAYTWWSE